MKTKKDSRFNLNKETITHLDLAKMAQVVGGTGPTGGTEGTETELDCDPKRPSTPCN